MKLTIFALLAGSAAAFAPSPNVARTSVVKATTFEGELGVQPPLGLWDPLGCLNGIDQDTFDRYRYAEIKHGRVAQLAFLGHLITALGIRFPGYLSIGENIKFSDVPAGLGALEAVPTYGLLQIFLFCGVLEGTVWKQSADSFPGDFGDSEVPVGWIREFTDEEKYDLRAKELNQGRAAMMGILALMVHEYHFGNAYIFWDLY